MAGARQRRLARRDQARVELSVDRFEDALRHFRRAETLDPRSLTIARRITYTYLRLRRYPEAITAADRAMALWPHNAALVENKVMGYLGQGDLDHARELVRVAEGSYDPTAIVANFGDFFDLYWVLPVKLPELLLRLTPDAFPDRATWGIVQTQLLHFRGDPVQARVYADSALLGNKERLRDAPDDPQTHVFRGLALAYLGRKAEAIAEGQPPHTLHAEQQGHVSRPVSPAPGGGASTSWWVSRRRRWTCSSSY